MFKIFKPNWIVLEVHHERYTFDTYYTYCRHMTLEEIEKMFILDKNLKEKDKEGNYLYNECCDYGDTYTTKDKDNETIEFRQYHINYTIVIPYKNKKQDNWWICGKTCNKFGLFDREYIETSTDE